MIVTATLPFGPDSIDRAAALIRAGQVVAVPTETVYGLAGDATNGAAVAAIYAAKGRPSFNPLIVHVPDLAYAERLAVFNDTARALATAFWPGALTLVLPVRADSGLSSLVTAGLGTVAIRVPAHRAMQALIVASERPLAAPSANASGRISPTRADHVAASLSGRIPLIIDDGATGLGLESTIIAPGDGAIHLLRPGPVTASAIEAVAGLPVRQRAESDAITAPGQLLSHYAPSKPVRLNATSIAPDEFWIGFGAIAGDATLSPHGDLVEAAARLFDLLHRADAAPHARIAVAPVPDTGLGVAINDRLGRAAHRD
jgi:L-threonylcarbamoyladenylate synthase